MIATAVRPPSGIKAIALIARVLTYLILIGGSILFITPFLWMVRTSLMVPENIYLYPPQLFPNPIRWANYPEMWNTGPFLDWVSNSSIVTVTSTIAVTITSGLAAYGFSRTRWPGRNQVFVFVLATLMMPYQVVLIPRYLLFNELGWINTLLPLIVPNLFGSAFYIFILRQFFLSLPMELDEAAKIDGAGMLTVLTHIVMPLAKPAFATVAIFSFIENWNDFIQPLIYLQTPQQLTLAVGIRWFTGQYGTEFHLLMAISVLALLPIIVVFFLAQKQFIRGIALTGLKA